MVLDVFRLEEMNDGRQSMVQRLKIVERERDGLEGARAAAEAYMDKERECTTAQCTIYQVTLWLLGVIPSAHHSVFDVFVVGMV